MMKECTTFIFVKMRTHASLPLWPCSALGSEALSWEACLRKSNIFQVLSCSPPPGSGCMPGCGKQSGGWTTTGPGSCAPVRLFLTLWLHLPLLSMTNCLLAPGSAVMAQRVPKAELWEGSLLPLAISRHTFPELMSCPGPLPGPQDGSGRQSQMEIWDFLRN